VLLNRGANISHDVEIESFASVGPGVTIAAGVTIGEGVYVGVGAVVRDRVTIGNGAVVAAGAVVVKSVAPRVLAAGCPARVVRENVAQL
jgi:acetyltransferase-like isoleucine patch superfamily enzyme